MSWIGKFFGYGEDPQKKDPLRTGLPKADPAKQDIKKSSGPLGEAAELLSKKNIEAAASEGENVVKPNPRSRKVGRTGEQRPIRTRSFKGLDKGSDPAAKEANKAEAKKKVWGTPPSDTSPPQSPTAKGPKNDRGRLAASKSPVAEVPEPKKASTDPYLGSKTSGGGMLASLASQNRSLQRKEPKPPSEDKPLQWAASQVRRTDRGKRRPTTAKNQKPPESRETKDLRPSNKTEMPQASKRVSAQTKLLGSYSSNDKISHPNSAASMIAKGAYESSYSGRIMIDLSEAAKEGFSSYFEAQYKIAKNNSKDPDQSLAKDIAGFIIGREKAGRGNYGSNLRGVLNTIDSNFLELLIDIMHDKKSDEGAKLVLKEFAFIKDMLLKFQNEQNVSGLITEKAEKLKNALLEHFKEADENGFKSVVESSNLLDSDSVDKLKEDIDKLFAKFSREEKKKKRRFKSATNTFFVEFVKDIKIDYSPIFPELLEAFKNYKYLKKAKLRGLPSADDYLELLKKKVKSVYDMQKTGKSVQVKQKPTQLEESVAIVSDPKKGTRHQVPSERIERPSHLSSSQIPTQIVVGDPAAAGRIEGKVDEFGRILSDQVGGLTDQVVTLSNEKAALAARAGRAEGALEVFKSQLSEKDKRIEELAREIKEARIEIRDLNKQLIDAERRNSQTLARSKDSVISYLDDEVQTLKSTADSLLESNQATLAGMQERISQVEIRDDLNAKIIELQRKLGELQKTKSESSSQDHELVAAKREIERLRKEINLVTAKLPDEDEISRLRSELKKVKIDRDKAKAAKETAEALAKEREKFAKDRAESSAVKTEEIKRLRAQLALLEANNTMPPAEEKPLAIDLKGLLVEGIVLKNKQDASSIKIDQIGDNLDPNDWEISINPRELEALKALTNLEGKLEDFFETGFGDEIATFFDPVEQNFFPNTISKLIKAS